MKSSRIPLSLVALIAACGASRGESASDLGVEADASPPDASVFDASDPSMCDDSDGLLCDGCEDGENRLTATLSAAVLEAEFDNGPAANVGACIETWARTTNDAVLLGLRFGAHRVNLECGATVSLGNGDGSETTITGPECDDGEWHHVALCARVDASGFNMVDAIAFLDGRSIGDSRRDNEDDEDARLSSVLVSGNQILGGNQGFDGDVDEIRVSGGARYDAEATFVPARRHAPDSQTLALFHLDGTLAADGSDVALERGAGSVSYAIDDGYRPSDCER